MSYLVLARKWRPQTFDDLVGQESVVRTVKNAIAQNRVAHAYVFSGPRGVGKTTTARLLAKALNCTEGPTAEPCGVCHACTAITGGSSVDVIEIDGASNNSVNDVRNLRETVQYAPASGRYKIYIIDEVHMLTDSAFNALLKTLEEPPAHVFFIFATTSPRKIPVTVLSRCQHLGFKRVPKSLIVDHLGRICAAEGLAAEENALEMLARHAGGSVRDALTLLDQASAFTDHITEEELAGMLGLPETRILREMTEAVLAGDRPAMLRLIAALADSGADLRMIPRELAGVARNLVVARVAGEESSLLDLPEDELRWVRDTAARATPEQLTLTLDEFLKLAGEIREGTVPRYALELGLLRASFFRGLTSFDSLIDRLEGTAGPLEDTVPRGTSGGATLPAPAAGAVREPADIYGDPEEDAEPMEASGGEETTVRVPKENRQSSEGDRTSQQGERLSAPELWDRVRTALEGEGGILGSVLGALSAKSLRNGVLEVVPGPDVNGFTVEKLAAEAGAIESVMTSILGSTARLRIGRPAPVPATGTEKPAAPPEDARRAALEHPVVQSAMDLFEGRITDIRLSGSET